MMTAFKSADKAHAANNGEMTSWLTAGLEAAHAPETGGAWVHVIPAGTFEARDGRGPFDAGDIASMEAIIARTNAHYGPTGIVIDYEHQTLMAPENGQPAPAAGWIKRFEARADGIWAFVEWTERARASIRAKEYCYLSPVFTHPKSGKGPVDRIVNAALTNNPALDLHMVAARASHSPLIENEDTTMDKELAKALGLKPTATVADAVAAITAMSTSVAALRTAAGLDDDVTADDAVTSIAAMRDALDGTAKALGLDDDADPASVTKAATAAMTAGAAAAKGKGKAKADPDPNEFVPMAMFTEVRDKLTALEEGTTAASATAKVEAAITSGKVTPGAKDWALGYAKSDPEGFDAFVSAQPTLTASQMTQGKPTKGKPALDEAEMAVCRQMGLSHEDFIASRDALDNDA